MVLSRRMIHSSRVSFVFPAKEAFRITALFCVFRRRNGLRVFLRLGKVNRNIQIPIPGRGDPLLIPRNAIPPDVIRIPAQLIEIICGFLRVGRILLPKYADHLAGSRRKKPHDLRVEKVTVNNAVLRKSLLAGVIQHIFQNDLQILHCHRRIFAAILQFINPKQLQKPVCCINPVLFFNQPGKQSVCHQSFDAVLNHFPFPPI